MTSAVQIQPNDTVAVVTGGSARAGDLLQVAGGTPVTALQEIASGHKIALKNIIKGELVLKYGAAIGRASADIFCGGWVHTHNLQTCLHGSLRYAYQKQEDCVTAGVSELQFRGYLRKNGKVGIRNEIWILPMVSCVNHTAALIAERFYGKCPEHISQIAALSQPFGCSQLGEDHRATVTILKNIAQHPNAAGVLLLSLGCENNTMQEFLAQLGDYDQSRIKYLVCQEHEDEIEAGAALVHKLLEASVQDNRSLQPLSKLCVGLKCGASDGFSGITANLLVGRVCNMLVRHGASVVLTEVPEMFGAETILMNRAQTKKVFDQTVELINGFKQYYISHNQPVYENPSPGNKEGGITTLEEKSLGCIQKGGSAEVTDVLQYGQQVAKTGLTLLASPGNDPVSITALASAGSQLLVFTTGRGNPLGSFVPTVKVASNTALAKRKKAWIDFDAGELLLSGNLEALAKNLFEDILSVADGAKTTCSENFGYKEIGIFKNGITL